MNTRQCHSDLSEKMDTILIKHELISIIHSLQFDYVYDLDGCVNELSKVLMLLDQNEAPLRLILGNNLNPEQIEATA